MKRMVFMLLVMALYLCCVQGIAAEPHYAERSDFRAMIDYTPIESYNIGGYTYINVDDLVNYGFDVTYDDATRSLSVTRIHLATPTYTKEMWESSIEKKTRAEIVYSDIKVYLDGKQVNSYYADNKVLIMIDELRTYGGFDWNNEYQTVSITIFQHELENILDTAENIVETEYDASVAFGRNGAVTYRGQVNENNLPHGIGIAEFRKDLSTVKYIGYFTDGKPDGKVYKETFHTVSRSYTMRHIYFVGEVDGSRKSIREYKGNENIQLLREPNFGVSILPIQEILEWTGPEVIPDYTIYTKGCYYEYWYGKTGTHEYRIWHDGNELQTILDMDFSGEYSICSEDYVSQLRAEYKAFVATSAFYEYVSDAQTYAGGAILTIGDEPAVLNDPKHGAAKISLAISVLMDGEEVKFDVLPVMQNDRVLVPVRAIFEKLGATVNWQDETQTVTATKGDKTVSLQIENHTMQIGEKTYSLDVAPTIMNSRTLVPLRAVSEAFEAEVDWNDTLKQVTITTK